MLLFLLTILIIVLAILFESWLILIIGFLSLFIGAVWYATMSMKDTTRRHKPTKKSNVSKKTTYQERRKRYSELIKKRRELLQQYNNLPAEQRREADFDAFVLALYFSSLNGRKNVDADPELVKEIDFLKDKNESYRKELEKYGLSYDDRDHEIEYDDLDLAEAVDYRDDLDDYDDYDDYGGGYDDEGFEMQEHYDYYHEDEELDDDW